MPWITVTTATQLGREASASRARDVAEAAAGAAALNHQDVIVLVQHAIVAWGDDAVVPISGRHRQEHVEEALEREVRRVMADSTGLNGDLISVVRG